MRPIYIKRVLVLTPGAYGVNGGIALQSRDVAEAIASIAEVEEVVVIPREVQFPPGRIPEKVRFLAQSAEGKLRFVWTALTGAGSRTDLLICAHVNLLPVAVALKLRFRVPLVLIAHGIEVWGKPNSFARLWLKACDSVWSVSTLTRERMNAWARLSGERYTILPNAIHVEHYGLKSANTSLKDRLGLTKRKVIMTLGRLPNFDRYKGVDEVLECMPSLLKREPSLTYLVVGDGDDCPRLETKALSLGLEGRVIFTGYVAEEEKADYYRVADAFVLPGRGEGFGFVFLEALACGVPVVGSLLDGSREALRGGLLGELVDPTDLSSVEAGILKALDKPKGMPDGLDYFAWPAFCKRVAEAVGALQKT